ncbi:MAG TPA: helix-hairpin-helix domain-containing protein [Thermoanaerobaculia bacterium]|jgi:competence ComEA-like helix-hairpin-helix protein
MRKLLFGLALFVLTLTTTAMAETVPAGVVNINTADVAQLSLLPRIGEKAAQRIVDYRTEHGPFRSVSDLTEVKGLGEKTVAMLSQYVALDGETTLTTKVASPRKPRANKPTTTASN